MLTTPRQWSLESGAEFALVLDRPARCGVPSDRGAGVEHQVAPVPGSRSEAVVRDRNRPDGSVPGRQPRYEDLVLSEAAQHRRRAQRCHASSLTATGKRRVLNHGRSRWMPANEHEKQTHTERRTSNHRPMVGVFESAGYGLLPGPRRRRRSRRCNDARARARGASKRWPPAGHRARDRARLLRLRAAPRTWSPWVGGVESTYNINAPAALDTPRGRTPGGSPMPASSLQRTTRRLRKEPRRLVAIQKGER
jgi:hypothetical protein